MSPIMGMQDGGENMQDRYNIIEMGASVCTGGIGEMMTGQKVGLAIDEHNMIVSVRRLRQ